MGTILGETTIWNFVSLWLGSAGAGGSMNRLLDSCRISQIIMTEEREVVVQFHHQRHAGRNI